MATAFTPTRHRLRGLALAAGAVALVGLPVGAAELGEVVKTQRSFNVAAAESQKRIDELADATNTMLSQYKTVLDQIDALKVYNRQMANLVSAQDTELAAIQKEIDEVELVGRQVTPLMESMVNSLEDFVKLDVPFLIEERSERIANLRAIMARADVSNAEKYRKIMEAYQIENEYGTTLEAYQGSVNIGGQDKQVDFLRVGRIALVYLTLDGSQAFAWTRDQSGTGSYVELPQDYRNSIKRGLRMARKQSAPDLFTLPIAAAETVQ